MLKYFDKKDRRLPKDGPVCGLSMKFEQAVCARKRKKREIMQRNQIVDILKGVCAVLVIITHFEFAGTAQRGLIYPYLIDMAVPVFMILSGYVWALSFQRREISTLRQAYLPSYLLARLLRYLLPFLPVYLLELVCNRLVGYPVTWGSAFANFFTGGAGLGSYYIPVMVQLTFLFPVLFFLVKKYRFSGLVLCGLLNAAYEFLQKMYCIDPSLYRILSFRYILLVSFGCYIALWQKLPRRWVNVLSLLAGAGFLFVTFYGYYTPVILVQWTGTSFAAGLYIMPIVGALLLSERCRKWKCPPAAFFGRASYHIFLTQILFYQYVSFSLFTRAAGVSSGLLLAFTVCVCLAAGSLFYLLERRVSSFCLKRLSALPIDETAEKIMEWMNRIFS